MKLKFYSFNEYGSCIYFLLISKGSFTKAFYFVLQGVLPPEQEPPTTESAPASGNTQSTNITTPASGNEGIN